MSFVREVDKFVEVLQQCNDKQTVCCTYIPYRRQWELTVQSAYYELPPPTPVIVLGGGFRRMQFWLTAKHITPHVPLLLTAKMLSLSPLASGVLIIRLIGNENVPLIEIAPDGRAVAWERSTE
jgi:hypothetical protein